MLDFRCGGCVDGILGHLRFNPLCGGLIRAVEEGPVWM